MTAITLDQEKMKSIKDQLLAIMETGIEVAGVKTSIKEVNTRLIAALKEIFQSFRALEKSDEELLSKDKLDEKEIEKFMEEHKDILATHPKFNNLKKRLEGAHDVEDKELLRLAAYIQNVYGDLLELIRLLEDEQKEAGASSGAEIKLLKDPAKSLFNDTDHIDAIELLAGNVKQSLNAQLEKFTQVNSKSKIVKDSQYVISDREKAIDKLDKYIRIQLTEEAKKAVEELTEEKIKEVYNKLVPIFTKKEYISGLIARAKRDVALDSTKNVKDYVIELFKKDVDEELKKIIVTAPAGTAVVTPPPAAGSPPGATGTTTPTTPIPFDPNAIKNSAKDKLIEKLSPHIIRLATAETRDESVKTMIKDIKEKFDKLIKTESSLAAFKPGEIGTLAKKIRIRISNVRHIIVNEPSLANRNTLIASFNADVVKHMQEYYINYDSKRNRDDILKRIEKWIPDLKEIQQAQGEATP